MQEMTPAQKIMSNFYKMKLAERGAALEGVVRGRQIVERLILKTQDGTIGQKDDDYPWVEDDMAVNVGDTNYYQQQPSPATGALGKAAVGAAMLFGGLGAGFGMSQIGRQDPVPVAPEREIPDFQDTTTRLELDTADGVIRPD